jgi:thiol-disulfide isomerase/thioredoxin
MSHFLLKNLLKHLSMRRLLYVLLAWLCPVLAKAGPQTIRPLTVGDTVPDIEFTHIANYTSATARLSDFRGKLVILDFWSSWCGSCMDAMPKMQSLQEQFSSRLQVLLVNTYAGDTHDKVAGLLQKRKADTAFALRLPYSLGQQALKDYFPHRSIPHYVWVWEGKVIATTASSEVTKENITALLSGMSPKLRQKRDLLDFDPQQPLYDGGNGGEDGSYLARTLWTAEIDGINPVSGVGRDSTGLVTRFYMLNHSLRSLVAEAYPFFSALYPARVIGSLPAGPGGTREVRYCYEASFLPATMAKAKGYLRDDLARQFGITLSLRKIHTKCLVLLPGGATVVHAVHDSCKPSVQRTGTATVIRCQPIKKLASILEGLGIPGMLPILDETGARLRMDLTIPNAVEDLRGLIQVLRQAGFEVAEAEREVEVAVMSGPDR